MFHQYYKLSIPIFTLLLFIGLANFYSGFMRKMITITRISKEANPYTDEMYFDSQEQKSQLSKRWFIPQTKKVVINFLDALPYYLVINQEQQEKRDKLNSNEPKYFEGRFKTITKYLNLFPNQTVLLRSWAEQHTSTTNRLIAYGTGTSSGALDYNHHIATTQNSQDNIFMHFNPQNETSIILGNDLWLQLFGDYIDVQQSKVVAKKEDEEESPLIYGELVDYIKNNKNSNNWNFLMFHDTTFDNTCHFRIRKFENKFDNPVFNKALKDVDDGANTTIEQIEDLDTTYMIMSDHGLAAVSATHGLLSGPERSATFFAYNKNGFLLDRNISQLMNRETLDSQMDQVDFTPSFCVLKGIAIPANNIGAIVPDIFLNLPWITNLYIANAYFTNIRQIEDFVKESSYTFPQNQVDMMFEKINAAKKSYQSIKDKQNILTKQAPTSKKVYQPTDEEIVQLIKHVRSASALIKEIYFETLEYDMVLTYFSVACLIIVIVCNIVVQCAFQKIISNSLQPYLPEMAIISKQTLIRLVTLFLVTFVVFLYFTKIFYLVLNIMFLVAALGIIGYSIHFLILQPSGSESQSIINRENKFSLTFDVQTLILLGIIGSLPIASYDAVNFSEYIDTYFLIVVMGIVGLISIHSLALSIFNIKKQFVFVSLRSLAIIALVYFTIYFDPKISKNTHAVIFQKWLLIQKLYEITNQPLFIIYLSLVFFSAFYIISIYDSTKFLRQQSSYQQVNLQQEYRMIQGMHLLNLLLSIIYFLCRQSNNYDQNFVFSTFFPITSLLIIILQLIYFKVNLHSIISFQEKYSLFFWSLLPFFLYFMGENSIFQIPCFFISMKLFQRILKALNYRQHLLMFMFLNLMSFIFNTTQGNSYRFVQLRKEYIQIGVLWENDFQYYANIFISNLTWFILSPLYIPIIFQKEVLSINKDYSLTNASFKKENYVQIPKDQNAKDSSHDFESNTVEDKGISSIVQQINSNCSNKNGDQSNTKHNILTLYCYEIKLFQSILQYLLFFPIAYIPNIYRLIEEEHLSAFDSFSYFQAVYSTTIIITCILSFAYLIFAKNMHASMTQKLIKYNNIKAH